ncbi:MAG: hypothetical protein AAGC96_12535 [Pseudomonadota bacterium]
MRTKLIIMGIFLGLSCTAQAAETTMSKPQLEALLTGNTVYIDVPAGSPAGGPDGGVAPIRYSTDGSVAAALPNGTKLVGRYAINGEQYCVDWDNGPQNSCTTIVKSPTGMMMFDAKAKEPRGTVNRIVPGNPENL